MATLATPGALSAAAPDRARPRASRRGCSPAARWCSRWSSSAASPASRIRACRSSSGSRSSARFRRCRDAQWQETFAKYQLTPEYQLVNKGMALDEFKGIFWWEYCASAARPPDRRRVPASRSSGSSRAGEIPPGHAWKLAGDLRAGRAAGRAGLVHGEERPRRRSARLAIPPDRAPRARARDLRGDVLGRRCRSSRRAARATTSAARRRDAGRSASSRSSS